MINRLLFTCLFILAFFSITPNSNAQPDINWEKNFGGTDWEVNPVIVKASDGGFVIAVRSESSDEDVSENNGAQDLWVFKLDDSGNMLWENSYGGSDLDEVQSIETTSDGGYILAGRSESSDGDVSQNYGGRDYWIVKLDVAGNLLWEKSFGGSGLDIGNHVIQSSDGGYIVAGGSESEDGNVNANYGGRDYWIIKLDESGDIMWEKNYGGSGEDEASSIRQVSDGGYLICGSSSSSDGDVTDNIGDSDIWIIKIDANGNLVWEKNYGGFEVDISGTTQLTSDGGFILAGFTSSESVDVGNNNGGVDCWVIKFDEEGNIEWEETYGGSNSEIATDIKQTVDGGYIICGRAGSEDGDVGGNQGGLDFWVIKIDEFGNIEWEQNYGGSEWDSADEIQLTDDGGYIIVGNTKSNDGDVSQVYGEWDVWVLKIGGSISTLENIDQYVEFSISPNPTSSSFIIQSRDNSANFDVKIVNVLGQLIYMESGILQFKTIDFLPKGQYFVEVVSETHSYLHKVVIQ